MRESRTYGFERGIGKPDCAGRRRPLTTIGCERNPDIGAYCTVGILPALEAARAKLPATCAETPSNSAVSLPKERIHPIGSYAS
jgi:hypothetical protein